MHLVKYGVYIMHSLLKHLVKMHFVTIALLLHFVRLTCLLIHNEETLHDFNTILVSGPNMASIVVK